MDMDSIIGEVREAAAIAFGDGATQDLTDEQCETVYRNLCCHPDGTPRAIETSVYDYLLGKPFRDIPDLATALKPKRRRFQVSPEVQREYDDLWIDDSDRMAIVEREHGPFGPGEEPAVQKMIERKCSLVYILSALASGNLFTAA